MNKVLIVCDLFPPAFAPRMGYLCKYLPKLGWEPVVVTEKVTDEKTYRFLEGQNRVVYVDYYTAPKGLLRKIQWLFIFILDFLFGYKDRKIYKAASHLFRKESFDVILCSTFRDFPATAAQKLSKKFEIPFILDLRDIVEQFAGNEFIGYRLPTIGGVDKVLTVMLKWKIIRRRNKVLKNADHVTTVSPWHVEMLRPYNRAIELVYNGYDPEIFFSCHQPSAYFTIIYTGRFLNVRMRDPSLLLKALKRLTKEKIFSPEICRMEWYVDKRSETVLYTLFKNEGLLDYMDFKGYVPANELPAALNRSSILLLLANKATELGPRGIMTTKIFEYLAVEKPILCVRSDESYLAELIHETQSGIAASTEEEVYQFLLYYYDKWKETGCTSLKVNRELIETFSREKQAVQFVRIFEKIMNKYG